MRYRLMTAFFGLPALIAACTDGTGPGSEPVASALAVSPAPAALNVARGDTIHVQFSVAVDSASCAARFLLHRGDSTGSIVPGRMRFADGYRHMMFIPDSTMAAQQGYFIHMLDSVMTRGGMGGGMGGDMGGGMGGGTMDGDRQMMLMTPPAGAMRMGDGGVGWSFTTGS